MTIRELIETLEAIEKEHGNVNVVNGCNPRCYEDGEKVKVYFHKKGDAMYKDYKYTRTEVEIR